MLLSLPGITRGNISITNLDWTSENKSEIKVTSENKSIIISLKVVFVGITICILKLS